QPATCSQSRCLALLLSRLGSVSCVRLNLALLLAQARSVSRMVTTLLSLVWLMAQTQEPHQGALPLPLLVSHSLLAQPSVIPPLLRLQCCRGLNGCPVGAVRRRGRPCGTAWQLCWTGRLRHSSWRTHGACRGSKRWRRRCGTWHVLLR